MVEKERVLTLLRELMAIESETGTAKEAAAEQYLTEVIGKMGHGVQLHTFPVPEDAQGRAVICGLLPGKKPDTVIFLNHHDVVSTEIYGALRPLACTPDQLLQGLLATETDPAVLADLQSGEWLPGRGSADMKGGAAAQLAVLEAYAKQGGGDVGLLFVSLPDEEAYSAGMRAALPALRQLQQQFGLKYRVAINCEPDEKEAGKLVAFTGSVGKLLPVVLVQGKSVHVGSYRQGVNPLGVMARIIAATEGNPALADTWEGESTPPPAWVYLRDRKEVYDVSTPQRVMACANFLTYTKTPEDLLALLTETAQQAAQEALAQVNNGLSMEVLTSAQLLERAQNLPGFSAFYEKLLADSFAKLQQGKSSYAQETIAVLEAVLDFTGFTQPLVLLSFAPPYYPAANSKTVAKEDFAGLCKTLTQLTPLRFDPYFNGVSDCSYCCVDPTLDGKVLAKNMPLWGKAYSFDFPAIAQLQIPFLLLGPWGVDLHQRTERVNVESVSVTLPQLLERVLAYMAETAE